VAGVGIGKSAQALLMRTRRATGKPGWAVLGAAPRPGGMPWAWGMDAQRATTGRPRRADPRNDKTPRPRAPPVAARGKTAGAEVVSHCPPRW